MANNQRVRQAPGRSSPFVTLNPALQIANRAPNVHDLYEQGTVWIYPAANAVWQLTSFANGGAVWTFLVSAAGTIDTLTGNVGGAVFPVGGNIDIVTNPAIGLSFTGTPGVLTLDGILEVGAGGTGDSSFTPFSLIAGGTTSTGPLQSLASLGTSGQVLTSNGAGMLPTWQDDTSPITITGDSGGPLVSDSFTFTGGTTGLTFSGAGTTETLIGDLNVAHGGSGRTSLTAYAVLCGGTTSTNPMQSIASVGTSGQLLTSNGAGMLPTFQAAPASSISITGDSGGALTGNAFTFTGGTTGLTFSGASTTETLGGTLAIANGGTNATSMATTDGVVYYDGTSLVTTAVGTAGQVLTSNGAGVAPTYQSVSGGFSSVVVQKFTTSGTYTPTAGMAFCTIEVVGGGGGGGGVAPSAFVTQLNVGGGGGAGGYGRLTTNAAAIGASKAVTIGAGGTAGDATGTSGGSGGTSSVGVLVTATGGSGGVGDSTSNNSNVAGGGAAGLGASGDVNAAGSPGGSGFGANVGVVVAFAGDGGSSFFGGGALGGSISNSHVAVVGVDGTLGGGGSGAISNEIVTGAAAGAGGAGFVVITEYIA